MRHTFKNILELFEAFLGGFDASGKEGGFVSPEKWRVSPDVAEIVFIDEEDLYVDDDDDDVDEEDVPREMREAGFDFLLVGSDLQSVCLVFSRQGRLATVDSLVQAVNHYAENDSFAVPTSVRHST